MILACREPAQIETWQPFTFSFSVVLCPLVDSLSRGPTNKNKTQNEEEEQKGGTQQARRHHGPVPELAMVVVAFVAASSFCSLNVFSSPQECDKLSTSEIGCLFGAITNLD